MLLREREKKKAANPRNMLVLLSDPALPRKAPRGGGGSGRAASLRARPRRPAGTPGHRANRAGGSSALRGQGQTVGGLRVRAERGRNISGGSGTPLPGPPHRRAGAGPRPPRRSPSGPRPWGRRAALPRRRREAAGPAAAARNRALGAAFRRGAARGSAAVGAQRCATTSGGSRCRWNVSVARRYAAPRQRRAGHLQVSAGERKTYTAPYRLRM